MAIQFNCPSCEAMIRVPDNAAGKKGTCPRCSEKLIVPEVAPPAEVAPQFAPASPRPVSAPPRSAQPADPEIALNPTPASSTVNSGLSGLEPLATPGLPDFGQPAPVAAEPDEASPLGLPGLSAVPSSVGAQLQRKLNTKKRKSQGAWMIPAVCALVFVGVLLWFLWTPQIKLEGELAAQGVRNLEVTPGLIPGDVSGLDKDDLGEVLRHLRAEPAHWSSSISKLTLTGTDEGVVVTIQPGTASHFVRVEPGKVPAYLDYVTKHADQLEKPRLATIAQYAPQLFAAWKVQFTKHKPIADQKSHRDHVVLPSLVTGIGYHLEAIANQNIYPCVYEDPDGRLYFLLPNATRTFTIRGRKVAGGLHVPVNFTAKVAGTIEAPRSEKKIEPKSQAERELENEGMNPDNYKLEIEQAREANRKKRRKPQSEGDALSQGLGVESGDKPDQTAPKSKSKKPGMMLNDPDSDLMDDEMPAKSKPKKGAAKKPLIDGEMEEMLEGEMPARPGAVKRKVPQ